MQFKGVETMGPFSPVRLQPVVEFLQGLRAEAVEPALRLPPDLDEACVAKHLQVPRDAGLVHPDDYHEVTHRPFTAANCVEDASPGGFGDRFKNR